jgi:hypothetical protein
MQHLSNHVINHKEIQEKNSLEPIIGCRYSGKTGGAMSHQTFIF